MLGYIIVTKEKIFVDLNLVLGFNKNMNFTDEFEITVKNELFVVAANVEHVRDGAEDDFSIDIIEVFDIDNNVVSTTFEQDEMFKERIVCMLMDQFNEPMEMDLD